MLTPHLSNLITTPNPSTATTHLEFAPQEPVILQKTSIATPHSSSSHDLINSQPPHPIPSTSFTLPIKSIHPLPPLQAPTCNPYLPVPNTTTPSTNTHHMPTRLKDGIQRVSVPSTNHYLLQVSLYSRPTWTYMIHKGFQATWTASINGTWIQHTNKSAFP